MNIEERRKNLDEKQQQIKLECEKLNKQMQDILAKSENAVSNVSTLDNCEFLKKFTSIYEFLHKLHIKILDANCTFEIFQIELNKEEILVPEPEAPSQIVQKRTLNPNAKEFLYFHEINTKKNSDKYYSLPNITKVPETPTKSDSSSETSSVMTTTDSTSSSTSSLKTIIVEVHQPQNDINFSDVNVRGTTPKSPEKVQRSSKNNGNRKATRGCENNWEISRVSMKSAIIPQENDLCFISYVISPTEFYIQVVSEDTAFIDVVSVQIEEMKDGLQTFADKKKANAVIEKYCVCFCEKNQMWYRAEIVDWLSYDDRYVQVRLVDYGNTMTCLVRNIRTTTQYLCKLPKMATLCSLAWLQPPSGLEWSQASLEQFQSLTSLPEHVVCTLTFCEHRTNISLVDLSSDEWQSLTVETLEQGIAHVRLPPEPNTFACNELMLRQLMQATANSQAEEETADLETRTTNYRAHDESQICRIHLSRGFCPKGDGCTFQHSFNQHGTTRDKSYVHVRSCNQLEMPIIGSHVTLKIINMVDFRSFYAIIKRYGDGGSPGKQCAGAVNTMKKLVAKMNSAESVKAMDKLTVLPAISEMVLVRNDGLFQRGSVLDFTEHSHEVQVQVHLVDLGVCVTVPVDSLRQIASEFLELPFQAVRCTLANTSVAQGLSQSQLEMGFDYLRLHVVDHKVKAKVLSNFGSLGVVLYDKNGCDIAHKLSAAGLVVRTERPITPHVNSVLLVD